MEQGRLPLAVNVIREAWQNSRRKLKAIACILTNCPSPTQQPSKSLFGVFYLISEQEGAPGDFSIQE